MRGLRETAAHARFERLVVRALTSADPAKAMRQAARAPGLTPDLRRALAVANPDGIRMAALLVARLRFERLVRGSPEAEAWFDRDPARFTRAFRAYHRSVPPSAFFPPAEAALFARWLARTATRSPRRVGAGGRSSRSGAGRSGRGLTGLPG